MILEVYTSDANCSIMVAVYMVANCSDVLTTDAHILSIENCSKLTTFTNLYRIKTIRTPQLLNCSSYSCSDCETASRQSWSRSVSNLPRSKYLCIISKDYNILCASGYKVTVTKNFRDGPIHLIITPCENQTL